MIWAILGLVFILIVLVVFSCIKVVPQAKAYVVERLGAYQETWNTGIHFKMPFIDRVAKRVNPVSYTHLTLPTT